MHERGELSLLQAPKYNTCNNTLLSGWGIVEVEFKLHLTDTQMISHPKMDSHQNPYDPLQSPKTQRTPHKHENESQTVKKSISKLLF